MIDATEGQMVFVGGIDTSTGRPLAFPLVAPTGTYVLSPLSTLAGRW